MRLTFTQPTLRRAGELIGDLEPTGRSPPAGEELSKVTFCPGAVDGAGRRVTMAYEFVDPAWPLPLRHDDDLAFGLQPAITPRTVRSEMFALPRDRGR
jgi:hypothetical protein